MTVIETGQITLGYLPGIPTHPEPRGRLLYLPAVAAIVVPERRDGDRWHCLVLASTVPVDRRIRLAPAVLDQAARDDLGRAVFPPDAELALLWQARVWQHSPGGPPTALAAALVSELAPTGDPFQVDLYPALVERLCRTVPGCADSNTIAAVVRDLHSARLLVPVASSVDTPGHLGRWQLAGLV